MTRKKTPKVIADKHAPMLQAAALHYARAASRYRQAICRQSPYNIAKVRFLEVATYFDELLRSLVYRQGPRGRSLLTATDAARIKAAAIKLIDISYEHTGFYEQPAKTARLYLNELILSVLRQRESDTRISRSDQTSTISSSSEYCTYSNAA